MSYKLCNTVFCCGFIFLFSIVSGVVVYAAQVPNKITPTKTTTEATVKQTLPVNLNLADIDTLQKIKGMSKKKAQAVINYRNKNGSFKSVEDLLKVNCRGIHKKWLDKISKFLTV